MLPSVLQSRNCGQKAPEIEGTNTGGGLPHHHKHFSTQFHSQKSGSAAMRSCPPRDVIISDVVSLAFNLRQCHPCNLYLKRERRKLEDNAFIFRCCIGPLPKNSLVTPPSRRRSTQKQTGYFEFEWNRISETGASIPFLLIEARLPSAQHRRQWT